MYFLFQVREKSQVWKWFNEVLIPATFADKWYNGKEERITEYIGNKRSILVGMPRLRQLRILKGTVCFAFQEKSTPLT